MNDLLFPVNYGYSTAASVMPYSGGDFVFYQRERNIFKFNQFTKLLTKFNSL